MDIAYRSEDDILVAFVSYDYASMISLFGELGFLSCMRRTVLTFLKNFQYPVLPEHYQFLAELLYRVREYNECIRYAKKAVPPGKIHRRNTNLLR